jgi:hypothetical protein
MRGTTITQSTKIELFIEDCITCGVEFGLPIGLRTARHEDHGWFYCPNGHSMQYTAKTDAEKLKEAKQQLASIQEDARIQAARALKAEEALNAERAETKRLKKRAEAGVCPVPGCKRSVVQMARHIKTQHPDYHEHP